jgi:hypothetical protein
MRRWWEELRPLARVALEVALILVALTGTGCPLMIASSAGSAVYEGYKYTHNKNQPAATASSTSTKKNTSTAKAHTHTIPDNEIE